MTGHLETPVDFCKDLSDMETARLPMVTEHPRLQKTAYPALLQRRKRREEEICGFFEFIRARYLKAQK